jgi:trehalose/maltose hydrolase-like predicted phosphorylase
LFIAAQVGDTHKAIQYGVAALLMDLADVGGNVKDGCHIASMGGTWMMLTYGLGGMRDDNGSLSFWPRSRAGGQRHTSVSRDISWPDAGSRNRTGKGGVHAA